MALAVDPAPTNEELAAIVAALEQLARDGVALSSSPARPEPSRWRAAARVYDDGWDDVR